MLYDTLAEGKQEDKYVKYAGKMISYGNFAEAIAGVLGGLTAAISIFIADSSRTG